MKIKLASPESMPTRAHPTDAGLDLRSLVDVVVKSGERTLVDTGVSVQIPVGYVGLLIARSSLGKSGLVLNNSVGVIDSAYRGPILAALSLMEGYDNSSISAGTRIVQLLVVPIIIPSLEVMSADAVWDDTERSVGGFGSTGTS